MTPSSALLSLLPADRRPPRDDGSTAAALDAWIEHAKARWSEVPTDVARVIALLGARLDAPLTASALADLDGAELWLAAGCTQGLAPAFAAFDRRYLGGLDRALAHMKLTDDRVAEVRQRVREKLLMPESGTSKLEQYAGRGQLATLVGVVAVRTALDLLRTAGRVLDVPDAGNAADALVDEHASPEFAAIKAEHADAFKAAFQAAVDALDPEDRGLLRLHLMERLGIDAIAALHGVHRSTAARWLQAVRDRVGTDVRRRLRERLGRARGDLDSLLRAVDSQLDLSFSRLLAR
ncbi:MAG: hypothetical protein IAG13_13210 [Deltaproteobacteria bacterium]|nr:hypothetical protein [Nannocystaceae bacterium]